MKRILFFLLAWSLVSCGNGPGVYVIGRNVVDKIPGEEVTLKYQDSLSGPFLDGAIGLSYVSDSTIVVQRTNTNSQYRAINLQDKKYVDFLYTGRGPEEMVVGFCCGSRNKEGVTLLDIAALNEGFLVSIDMGATMREGRTVIRERADLLPGATASFVVGDDILSTVVYDEDFYSLKLYDKESLTVKRVVRLFGEEPYLAQYQPQFESVRRIKPDREKLALLMANFDEVNIFDLEGEDHLSISIPKRKKDKQIIGELLTTHRLNTHNYYKSGTVTNEAIYGLYYDCGAEELSERNPVIHVFSWGGELKAIYHLDEQLYSIAITEDGKTLYGLTEEEVLYKYVLN